MVNVQRVETENICVMNLFSLWLPRPDPQQIEVLRNAAIHLQMKGFNVLSRMRLSHGLHRIETPRKSYLVGKDHIFGMELSFCVLLSTPPKFQSSLIFSVIRVWSLFFLIALACVIVGLFFDFGINAFMALLFFPPGALILGAPIVLERYLVRFAFRRIFNKYSE